MLITLHNSLVTSLRHYVTPLIMILPLLLRYWRPLLLLRERDITLSAGYAESIRR